MNRSKISMFSTRATLLHRFGVVLVTLVTLGIVEREARAGRGFLAGLAAVERVRREAEEVLHRECHPGGEMVFELGQGDQHIGVLVGVVQVEGGEHQSAPRDAQVRVFLALAQVARVLELDLAQGGQRRHVPARLCQHGLQPVKLLRGFDEAHPPGADGEQQRAQRQRRSVVGHVRFADLPTKERFEVTSSQVQLHGDGLVLDERADAAEQVKTLRQRREDFRPISAAGCNCHFGGGAVGPGYGLNGSAVSVGGQQAGNDAQKNVELVTYNDVGEEEQMIKDFDDDELSQIDSNVQLAAAGNLN